MLYHTLSSYFARRYDALKVAVLCLLLFILFIYLFRFYNLPIHAVSPIEALGLRNHAAIDAKISSFSSFDPHLLPSRAVRCVSSIRYSGFEGIYCMRLLDMCIRQW